MHILKFLKNKNDKTSNNIFNKKSELRYNMIRNNLEVCIYLCIQKDRERRLIEYVKTLLMDVSHGWDYG